MQEETQTATTQEELDLTADQQPEEHATEEVAETVADAQDEAEAPEVDNEQIGEDDQPEPDWLKVDLNPSVDTESDVADNSTSWLEEVPKLDIDDPQAQARWEQQWKGLQKMGRRVAEQEQAVSGWLALDEAYGSGREAAERVVQAIMEDGRKRYGDDFMGSNDSRGRPAMAEPEDGLGWDWDWDGAPKQDATVTPEAMTEALKALGIDPDQLRPVLAEQAERKAQSERVAQARSELPEVNRQLQASYPGVSVTEDDVVKAMARYPHNTAIEAVTLFKSSDLKRAVYQAVRGDKRKPELHGKGQGVRATHPVSNRLEDLGKTFSL